MDGSQAASPELPARAFWAGARLSGRVCRPVESSNSRYHEFWPARGDPSRRFLGWQRDFFRRRQLVGGGFLLQPDFPTASQGSIDLD